MAKRFLVEKLGTSSDGDGFIEGWWSVYDLKIPYPNSEIAYAPTKKLAKLIAKTLNKKESNG
jgi:hypothetical protein